jgi:hypothetical protein
MQASNETCSCRFIDLLDGNPCSRVSEDAYILQTRKTLGLQGRVVAGLRNSFRRKLSSEDGIMACINWKSIITRVFISAVILTASFPVLAQWSASISQGEILQPWEQHLAVLQSLSGLNSAADGVESSAQIAKELATLEADIGAFGQEIEKFIYRLAGEPAYVYVVAETSLALSARLATVHAQFHSLYLSLGIGEREDVITAQASLDALRGILRGKIKFENDITNALGSGSRRQIMGVANRWWVGKEKSDEVLNLAASLRQQLEGVTASEAPE